MQRVGWRYGQVTAWGGEYQKRRLKLPDLAEGCTNKRSTSAPPEEPQHHIHLRQFLDACYEAAESSPIGSQLQDGDFAFVGRSSRGLPVLNIEWPREKDVGSFQPKMRNKSSVDRNRKHHRHSSDIPSFIDIRDSASPLPEEEVVPSASLFDSEKEGIATSCKRIKLSARKAREYLHSSAFISESQPKLPSVEEVEGFSKGRDSRTVSPNVDFDGAARERKSTITGKAAAAKKSAAEVDFWAHYNGSPTHLPDFRYDSNNPVGIAFGEALTKQIRSAPSRAVPVAIVPGMFRMVNNERKTVGALGGSFRPQNTLQRNHGSSSPLPRASGKVFDFHQGVFDPPSDEQRARKRRRLNSEKTALADSSRSVIDLSGEGSRTGTAASPSLRASIPHKSARSGNQRSLRQQSGLDIFGNVDAYRNMEAIVGFSNHRESKDLRSELRRTTSSDQVESSSGHMYSGPKRDPPLLNPAQASSPDTRESSERALVHESEIEEIEEVSPKPKRYHDAVQGVSTRQSLFPNVEGQRASSKQVRETAKDSPYFAGSGKRRTCMQEGLDVGSTRAQDFIGERSISVCGGSPDPLQRPANTPDDVQYLEDSVDMLDPDESFAADDPEEIDIVSQKNLERKSAKHVSGSIYTKGDIPRSFLEQGKSKPMQAKKNVIDGDLTFYVTYMQAGLWAMWITERVKTLQLQYNHHKHQFDIVSNGDDIVSDKWQSLILKPDKIRSVKSHKESQKLVITRSTEPKLASTTATILVQTQTRGECGRLVQCLRDMNSTIKILPTEDSEYLDRVFTRGAKLHNEQLEWHSVQTPQDVALIKVKEARLATEEAKARQRRIEPQIPPVRKHPQPANTSRRHSIAVEEVATTIQNQRQIMANEMVVNTSDDAKNLSEILNKTYGEHKAHLAPHRTTASTTREMIGHRPNTRASIGHQNGGDRPESPERRSSSPGGWTRDNPRWIDEEGWKSSLVFPAEGKKRATVDAEDIERLDDGNFLNDNLIAFYLRYLEDRLEKSHPELAKRVYFQNTFFYASLTKGKVRSNNINYEAVKRWTKVDIFAYDYIIVPVNESRHWYVAIICNTPKLLRTDAGEDEIHEVTDEQHASHVLQPPNVSGDEGGEESARAKGVTPGPEPNILEQLASYRRSSASPSVTGQVEHMSLEDTTEDWPEPDAIPEQLAHGVAQVKELSKELTSDEDAVNNFLPGSKASAAEMQRKKRKKQKRKSMPTPRKYNPKEPRIITLDSLGGAHSPTCSNLLEYLVCEAKARHGIEIQASRLGMTAKGLPQQSNYCDCGVFVLGYIEKFLKNPDRFVQDILRGQMAENNDWNDMQASKMRESIRELIFELQAQQTIRNKHQRILKSKTKKTDKDPAHTAAISKSSTNIPDANSTDSSRVQTPMHVEADHVGSQRVTQQASAFTDGRTLKQLEPENSIAEEISPMNLESQEITPVEPEKLTLVERILAKQSNHKMGISKSKDPDLREMEVVARAVPNFASANVKNQRESARPVSSSSNPSATFREPSVELVSSSNLANSHVRTTNSSPSKESKEISTKHIMKQFARPSTSPYRNTRHHARQNGTNMDDPVEIDDPQESALLEIGETPSPKKGREDSFEDLSDLPAGLLQAPSSARAARNDSVSSLTSSSVRTSHQTTRNGPRASGFQDSSPFTYTKRSK